MHYGFFEECLESDNAECKKIRAFPIFSILKARAEEDNKKKKSKWNTFNLLPNEEFGDLAASIYFHKAVCSMVAENVPDISMKLYEEYKESDVWDLLAINNAVNYIPK